MIPWQVVGEYDSQFKTLEELTANVKLLERQLIQEVNRLGYRAIGNDIRIICRGPGVDLLKNANIGWPVWHQDGMQYQHNIIWCNKNPTIFKSLDEKTVWHAEPNQFVLYHNLLCKHTPPPQVDPDRMFFWYGPVGL